VIRRLPPSICLLAVAFGAAAVLRSLFFSASEWLWRFVLPFSNAEVTPWTRSTLIQRDGAEPYALLAMVFVEMAATAGGTWLLVRLPAYGQAAAVAMLLAGSWATLRSVSLTPPMFQVTPDPDTAWRVVAVSLLIALSLRWSSGQGRKLPLALPLMLVVVCFVPTSLPSLLDLPCILSPALRMQHGIPLRDIYMQYDLLPSLLALAWHKLDGGPLVFSAVVGGGSFFVMLLGVFWLSGRLFSRPDWAVLLVTCLVLVRVYGVMMDASATPQVTPLRLELWLLLVAVTLSKGLQHWLVGLTLGLLFFFARSMGTLYLAAYGLALTGDFIARRLATVAAHRRPFVTDLRGYARPLVAPLLLIAAAILGSRLIFGNFGSDAVALYRRLGVGMLRIGKGSFFWWILPLLGVLGCLAVIRARWLERRRAQATVFVVALVIANSLYFFGRSHEHNLVNLSTGFLLCLFLALDLASPAAEEHEPGLRRAFGVMPWLVVGYCAFFYSGRVLEKVGAQHALVARHQPLPPAVPSDFTPAIHCDEIGKAAGDGRVFFFSANDFFFYHQCGYVPQGYVQPVALAVMKRPLVQEMNRLLDEGYKIVVPQQSHDWGTFFPEFQDELAKPEMVATPHYQVFRRATAQ
jgi:hypothetical protein